MTATSMTNSRKTVFLLSLSLALSNSGSSMVATIVALTGAMLVDPNRSYDLPLLGVIKESHLPTLPVAFQFIFSMLTSQPASLLMRSWGRKPAFLLGQLIGVASGLMGILAIYWHYFPLLVVAGALVGCSGAFFMQYRFAAADVADEDYKDRAISLVMAGPVLAAFLGPELARHSRLWFPDYPFSGSYLALAGLAFAVIILLSQTNLPAKTSAKSSRSQTPTASWTSVLGQTPIILAMLSSAVGYATMTLIMSVTPLSMKACGFSFDDSAFVIEWHVLAMFAPSFVTGRLIKRLGQIPIIWLGVILEVTAVAINLSGLSFYHFAIGLATLGLGWNFCFIGSTSLLVKHLPADDKERWQGFSDTLMFSLIALASLSSGAMEQVYGWQLVNLTALPGLFILAVALLLFGRQAATVSMAKG